MNRAEGIKRATIFTVVVFLVACLAGFTFYAFGGRVGRSPWFGLMGFLYMWIPAVAAIALQKWLYKEGVVGPLEVSFKLNRWWLVGLFIPPIAMYLAFGLSLLMPDVSLAMDMSGVLESIGGLCLPNSSSVFSSRCGRCRRISAGWYFSLATAGLSFLVRGGNDLTVGITGVAGMLGLALINLGIFLYERGFSLNSADSY